MHFTALLFVCFTSFIALGRSSALQPVWYQQNDDVESPISTFGVRPSDLEDTSGARNAAGSLGYYMYPAKRENRGRVCMAQKKLPFFPGWSKLVVEYDVPPALVAVAMDKTKIQLKDYAPQDLATLKNQLNGRSNVVYVSANFHEYRSKVIKEVIGSIAKTGKCRRFDPRAGGDLGEGLVAFSELTCAQSIHTAVEIDAIQNKAKKHVGAVTATVRLLRCLGVKVDRVKGAVICHSNQPDVCKASVWDDLLE